MKVDIFLPHVKDDYVDDGILELWWCYLISKGGSKKRMLGVILGLGLQTWVWVLPCSKPSGARPALLYCCGYSELHNVPVLLGCVGIAHPGGFPNEFHSLLQDKPCMSTIRGRLGAVSNWCSRSQHEQSQELHTGSTLTLLCLRMLLPLALASAFPVNFAVLQLLGKWGEQCRGELHYYLEELFQEVAFCHCRRCHFAWILGMMCCCILMCPILQIFQLLWGSEKNKILLDLHQLLYLSSEGRGYIQNERLLLLLQADHWIIIKWAALLLFPV